MKRAGHVVNKWWVFWPMLIAYVFLWAVTSTNLADSQFIRNLRGLTPFYDVRVSSTTVLDLNMIVRGTFKKRRCERVKGNDGVSAWVNVEGNLIPAEFDSSMEGRYMPENRPIGPDSLIFTWIIKSPVLSPESAVVFVYHDCPEGRVSSKVFEIKWESSQ